MGNDEETKVEKHAVQVCVVFAIFFAFLGMAWSLDQANTRIQALQNQCQYRR